MMPQSIHTTARTVAQPVAPQMDTPTLARRCALESERFTHGKPHDTSFAHELFRRALVERDDDAWSAIYELYRPLVEHWIRRSSIFANSCESSEYLVASAFIRFWRAVKPARFGDFPTLGALLNYLRRCADCVVIDSARGSARLESWPEADAEGEQVGSESFDDEAISRISRAEFWQTINAQLHGDAERVVVMRSFVLGMKPCDIYSQHKDLFSSVEDVYSVKRNVMVRLRRRQELRHLLA